MQVLPKTSTPSGCGHGHALPDRHTIGQLFRDYGEEYIRIYRPDKRTIQLIRSIRVCGTPALGGRRIICKQCGIIRYQYFCCGNSQCPQSGMTAVLHTWGSDLKYHVHVHCLVTFGGLEMGPQPKWKWPKRKKQLAGYRKVCGLFRAIFLAELKRLMDKGQVVYHPYTVQELSLGFGIVQLNCLRLNTRRQHTTRQNEKEAQSRLSLKSTKTKRYVGIYAS